MAKYKSAHANACDISKQVKDEVWKRDRHKCIFCNSPNSAPNMHYKSRAQLGLGIPQNIGTGCLNCHHKLDNTEHRPEMLKRFKEYLQNYYGDDWDESKLIYKNRWEQ